jgi:hypothetical protein
LTPSASSTSAEPARLDIARLPCLATLQPAPATTKAAPVETLIEPDSSPPVPQVSTTGWGVETCRARSRMTRAMPAISSTVSPLKRSAVTKAAICAGVASPAMISSIAAAASVWSSDPPAASLTIASRITPPSPQTKELSPAGDESLRGATPFGRPRRPTRCQSTHGPIPRPREHRLTPYPAL